MSSMPKVVAGNKSICGEIDSVVHNSDRRGTARESVVRVAVKAGGRDAYQRGRTGCGAANAAP